MFLFRHNWPAKIEKKSESRALRPKKNVPNDGTNSGFGCRRPILAAVSGPSTNDDSGSANRGLRRAKAPRKIFSARRNRTGLTAPPARPRSSDRCRRII